MNALSGCLLFAVAVVLLRMLFAVGYVVEYVVEYVVVYIVGYLAGCWVACGSLSDCCLVGCAWLWLLCCYTWSLLWHMLWTLSLKLLWHILWDIWPADARFLVPFSGGLLFAVPVLLLRMLFAVAHFMIFFQEYVADYVSVYLICGCLLTGCVLVAFWLLCGRLLFAVALVDLRMLFAVPYFVE
jgi:hypothetical protein